MATATDESRSANESAGKEATENMPGPEIAVTAAPQTAARQAAEKPASKKAAPGKSTGKKPASGKSTARKSTSAKAATKKAATKKVAGRKATAKKRKTAAKKTATDNAAGAKTARRPAAAKRAAAGGKSDAGYNDPSLYAQRSRAPARRTVEQPMIKALRAEHRHMATVMKLFTRQLDAIEAGELVDTHVVYEIMDYMVTWPDRFHHPREDLIYALVAERSPDAADEVDSLQRDHDDSARRGKQLLREIERWRRGDSTGAQLIRNGRAYIDHIHEHMNLEEKLVFPHIEETLVAADWRELAADDRLAAVAEPVFGPKVQREFRNLSRKLRRSLRRSVERGTMVEWIGIEAVMESVEVLAIAYESARDSAGDHLRDALRESGDLILEAPLRAPWRMAVNNARVGFRLLGDMLDISRDTLEDLSRVNQERRDRVRLLDRDSPRR